jgi:hypothetical protein
MDKKVIEALLIHFNQRKVGDVSELLKEGDHSLVKSLKSNCISAFLVLVGRNIDWVGDMMFEHAFRNEAIALNTTINTFIAIWSHRSDIPIRYELPDSKFRYHIFDFTMWYYGINKGKERDHDSLRKYLK